MVDTVRLRKRRDSKDNGATVWPAIKMCTFKTFATEVETARLCRPKRRRCDFLDQGGDGATFQTEVETARPRNHSSLPKRRRHDFSDQGGDGATFQTNAETARLFRPMRRRRNFSDQSGDGAIFQTEVETARPRLY